jgi:hypothetical protein
MQWQPTQSLTVYQNRGSGMQNFGTVNYHGPSLAQTKEDVDFKENIGSQLSEIKSQIKTAGEELAAVINSGNQQVIQSVLKPPPFSAANARDPSSFMDNLSSHPTPAATQSDNGTPEDSEPAASGQLFGAGGDDDDDEGGTASSSAFGAGDVPPPATSTLALGGPVLPDFLQQHFNKLQNSEMFMHSMFQAYHYGKSGHSIDDGKHAQPDQWMRLLSVKEDPAFAFPRAVDAPVEAFDGMQTLNELVVFLHKGSHVARVSDNCVFYVDGDSTTAMLQKRYKYSDELQMALGALDLNERFGLFAEDFPGAEEEGDYLEMYAVVANSHRQEVAAPLGKLLQLVASQATKCTVLTPGSKFAETLPLLGEVIRSILIETECAITFQKTDFTTTQLESMETDGKHAVTFDRCIYSGNKSKVINGTFAVRNAMTDITFKCTRCDVVAPLDGPCDCMRRMASQRIQSVTHRWMERRRSATVVIQKAARCTIEQRRMRLLQDKKEVAAAQRSMHLQQQQEDASASPVPRRAVRTRRTPKRLGF